MTEKNKAKTINLYCPSLSKIARIVAWEDQRLDLGSIAGTFGLEPSTLKLNGHFISRGVDLIASSVTWKSLLSFFSARGLSTGTADSSALVVDGKLSKFGTKRAHGTAAAENGVLGMPLQEVVGDGGKPWHEDTNVLKKQKLKDSNCGYENEDSQMTLSISSGLKRKHWLENSSLFKKSKANGIYSDTTYWRDIW
ncbi:hypothetical protein Nepgr_004329 [Nepenthes gracilis]|uniref:Uncharacterized protein n=1 Tax=Nepenthes gracilis TaxID=150966 RepID=A0AAD3XF34_NEPGR|nr:hypothetical protein Nepgr_004329 [Nepenthes gracilis]